jgi:hypothetical protein
LPFVIVFNLEFSFVIIFYLILFILFQSIFWSCKGPKCDGKVTLVKATLLAHKTQDSIAFRALDVTKNRLRRRDNAGPFDAGRQSTWWHFATRWQA